MKLSVLKKFSCAVAVLMLLTGCTKGDNNSSAVNPNGSVSKNESQAEIDSESTVDNGENSGDAEHNEFVLNESVIEFSKPSGVYAEEFSLELKEIGRAHV